MAYGQSNGHVTEGHVTVTDGHMTPIGQTRDLNMLSTISRKQLEMQVSNNH